MLDILKMAVVGCGYFGEKHATVISQTCNAKLMAVCDTNGEAAKGLAEKLKCKYYTDIESMLSNEEIDAVSVAVPAPFHLDAVRPVAKAKKHILLEKPIAHNTQDALEIVKLAKENGVRLMVAHLLKFDPRYEFTAQAIKRGEFGDIISMYLKRSSTSDTVRRIHGAESMFHYMGVHDFEAMLTFSEPAKPVKAYAQWVSKKNAPYNGQDTSFSTITFDNGIVACIQLCWALPNASLGFVPWAEIVGTKAAAYIDTKFQGVEYYQEGKEVIYPEIITWPEYFGKTRGILGEEIRHFVEATLMGEEYLVSTERAVEAVRVIDACFESLKTGLPAEIKN